MRFVLNMAAREMRASWHRLLFFFVCIAIGVGAIVTLRSVIQSVRATFDGEARALLTADAVINSNQAIKPELIAKIDARLKNAGAESVNAIELATMTRPSDRSDGRARMVELRAVEAGFPFYGEMKLEGDVAYDHSLLRNFGVLVRPELLAQLDVKVGDRLTIGSQRFTIRGVITSEPGRRLGTFTIGPRVFVDAADLEKTGLIGFGSRIARQRLLKVPPAALDQLVTDLREDFKNEFVRVRSYKAAEDALGEDFERSENYLSLVGLVIVILGGIGVSSVTRVFVQQKMKSIAVLKCVGARSSQLLAIYVAQVVLLGLAGSLLGVAIAAVTMQIIPSLLSGVAPGVEIDYGLTVPAVLQGLGIGLLVSLLFSLVPLLEVRHVKPSLLLRNEQRPRRPDLLQIAVTAGVVAGLVGLTVWQAGSLRIGAVVAGGFAATAIVLHLAGSLLIRAIRPLSNARSFALRHAVLQLSRPGSQMRIVLLSVGLGSFFIIGVRSLQENLVTQFAVNINPTSPDMFLLDIQRDQVDPVKAAITTHQPGAEPRLLPVLRARVVGVSGRDVNLEDYEDVRGRGSLGREYTITYRSHLEANERIVAGQMWDHTPSEDAEVSIEQFINEQFKINIGDTVRFDILGRVVSAKVTSVRVVEWSDSRAGGFMFVFRPGVVEKAPHSFVGFLRGPQDPAVRSRLQADLVNAAPNVSVIDGREIIDTIKSVVDNVTLAVTVVGTLVVLSGLLILVGAVAMTKFRRVYEAAIFKTLGATRRLIATVLLLEYGLLGLLAGAIGAGGAIGLTWAVSRYALDIPFTPLLGLSGFGVIATAVIVALIGVASSWEVLQKKPLATLRAE
ncbi:MAG TPA: FtsX-like permease family protein [Vicinamibacterales bacterium]|nr:FtsX-like permease family protein [Vicinamibacterales bacterium]